MNRAANGCLPGLLALSLAGAIFAQELPPGKGKPLVQRACTTCHELIIGSKQRMDRERWTALVEDMVERGAKLSEEETAEVVEYLAANFGPAKNDAPKVNINQAGAEQLVRELGLAERDSEAIVRFRDAHGPYKDFSSLKKVPDLDQAKIDALKDRLAF
jgi:competence ComEA-like helix-hairpin-helix protein